MTREEVGVALLLGLVLGLMLLAGCSELKVEGDCVYTRKVETTYQCEPGGKVEHIKVGPLPNAPE